MISVWRNYTFLRCCASDTRWQSKTMHKACVHGEVSLMSRELRVSRCPLTVAKCSPAHCPAGFRQNNRSAARSIEAACDVRSRDCVSAVVAMALLA